MAKTASHIVLNLKVKHKNFSETAETPKAIYITLHLLNRCGVMLVIFRTLEKLTKSKEFFLNGNLTFLSYLFISLEVFFVSNTKFLIHNKEY